MNLFSTQFAVTAFLTGLLALSPLFPAYGIAPDKTPAWSKEETALLRSLWIGSLPPPPKDPTNQYSGNPKAEKLGQAFFFDKRFSKNGKVSCGTCHEHGYSFTEDMPRAHGIGSTVRRTNHLIGMAYNSWYFWDGRADSLWAQALGPLENPNEHGISRTLCARIIAEHYRKEYEEVFGPLPSLPPETCIPFARPDPDDREAYAAWTSLPPGKGEEITRVYVNMGKAIAAYVRIILPGPAKFDRYVEALTKGDTAEMGRTLDRDEVEGLRLFIGKAKCVKCHSGPLFTNGEFRNTAVYKPSDLPPDKGRADGIGKVLASEFNCLGKYSNAGPGDCRKLTSLSADTRGMTGAFKVPSLRNVAERPPYMHAGQYWALWEVLSVYNRLKPSPEMSPDLLHDSLNEREMDQVEAFLKTLSGPLIFPKPVGTTDKMHGH
jgi:cytochrome c peroxidase